MKGLEVGRISRVIWEGPLRHRREESGQRTERVKAEAETGDGVSLTLNVESEL